MASASACVKAHKCNSVKAMTSEAIDLDQSRLRLCIEILPETEQSPERLVIISICRDLGRPLIRTIALSALTPIPAPLAEIIQDYADSDLACPVQPNESTEEEQKIPAKPEFSILPRKTDQSSKSQQQALQL
jgi:hypothetical protein